MAGVLFFAVVVSAALGQAELGTPAQAAAVALADVQRQPLPLRTALRYLDLSHLAAVDRARLVPVLAGHVNHLSRANRIRRPGLVAGGRLVRLNIEDYGWPAKLWETLGNDDPWFHVRLVVETAELQEWGHHDNRGTWVMTKKVPTGKKIRHVSAALAPWLGAEAAALAVATASQVPIVRGDWFLWQTALQHKRQPGYYDFLGIGKRADFERLVGFDAKLLKESRRLELLEAVSESGVSQQPRRIGAFPTIGGMRLWKTFDSDEATDNKNPLAILDTGNFEFDASEEFGPLPNNLWAFGLFDAKGGRQDSAPDFVGYDVRTHGNDGRIHVGLACIRCHYPNAGINPFDGWARNLYKPPLKLQSPDRKVVQDLEAQYLRDLDGPAADDRRVFTRALAEAAGLSPKEYAAAYAGAFAAYDAAVSLPRAAALLGTSPAELLRAIDAELKASGSVDPVLGVYLLPEKRARPVPIKQFHERVFIAQQLLRRIQR